MLLAFDNLDALAPAQALDLIETAHSLLGPRLRGGARLRSRRIGQAGGDADRLRSRLDKLFQLTFNVRLAGASSGGRTRRAPAARGRRVASSPRRRPTQGSRGCPSR